MKILVAMSGGVDSSVAAALLVEQGHDVTGVTLKLWGGESDSGCCSVADVDDARRVARQLDVQHLVFNFGDDFNAHVVEPYVAAHAAGATPNPCIECNRHLKFDRLVARADALGFDAVATGHHARVVAGPDGPRIARGADRAKDQSYVLYMVGGEVLARVLLPVGTMTKDAVRAHAARLGLRTATKPDSQDVCFITATGGRRSFLGERIPLRPGRVVDQAGAEVGHVDAVELVTVGQRKGLGLAGEPEPRYAVAVDVAAAVVTVGPAADLLSPSVIVGQLSWAGAPAVEGRWRAQTSAHGETRAVQVTSTASRGPSGGPSGGPIERDEPGETAGTITLTWLDGPQRRVAKGQSVVLYDGDQVLGGGIAR